MRHDPVTLAERSHVDWKGIGYGFSMLGMLLMGAEAMPKPTDPWWYWPALIGGVLTSIAGFAIRYIAHRKQRREIKRTEAKADQKR